MKDIHTDVRASPISARSETHYIQLLTLCSCFNLLRELWKHYVPGLIITTRPLFLQEP